MNFKKIFFPSLSFLISLITLPLIVHAVLSQPAKERVEVKAKEEVVLSLSPKTKELVVDIPVEVKILLKTDKYQIDGVDVILNYDPDILEVLEIKKGEITELKSYPLKETEDGQVLLSANIGSDTSFLPVPPTGKNFKTLGSVLFKPLKPSQSTELTFEFTPGERNDSNVVEFLQYTDILGAVEKAEFTILSAPKEPNLTLSPSYGNFKVGQEFEVEIILNTAGQEVDGVDAEFFYDQAVLEAISLAEGNIPEFTSYPLKEIKKGKVELSANIEGGEDTPGVLGDGLVLGKITFKALSETESARVWFDFSPGERNDSNLSGYKKGEDILISVTDASFVITSEKRVTLNLKIGLEGCQYAGAFKKTSLTLKIKEKTFSQKVEINELGETKDLILEGITPGSYDFLIKAAGRLQKKFVGIEIRGEGVDELDLSDNPLLAGDLDQTGRVNALDYNIFLAKFKTDDWATDFDCSTQVNTLDFSYLLRNWNKFGDEEGED